MPCVTRGACFRPGARAVFECVTYVTLAAVVFTPMNRETVNRFQCSALTSCLRSGR